MAIIYLSHSEHGAKVAMDEMEAKNDEANGWTRFIPEISVPSVEPVKAFEPLEVVVEEIEPVEELIELKEEVKDVSAHLDKILGKRGK